MILAVFSNEFLNILATIVVAALAVIGGIWSFFKLFYSYKSKFLFVTNCQILHKSLWEAIYKRYRIELNGDKDHAFRPLIILPYSLKKYSSVENGQKAILEFYNPVSNSYLKTVAEVYWVPPDMEKWNKMPHPALSLILRRYFGIERPLYQDDKEVPEKWQIVKHHKKHLDALHKTGKNRNIMQWAVSKEYTYRYFDVDKSTKEEPYYSLRYGQERFIEYCGLSMTMRKYSFFTIDKS